MQRPGSPRPDPGQDDESVVERLRSAVVGLLDRVTGGRSRQALPLSDYHGQAGPVVPYHERRHQLLRARRQDSSYALVFIVVLLVLVVGLFYGLSWALGGLPFGGGARPTPTVPPRPTAPAAVPSPTLPLVALPTAAPGGTAPSPSPLPGVAPAPGPGTPDTGGQRSYVVKSGDTPNSIAREFNVSPEALMRANNITDPRALKVGDRLTIPPSPTPPPR